MLQGTNASYAHTGAIRGFKGQVFLAFRFVGMVHFSRASIRNMFSKHIAANFFSLVVVPQIGEQNHQSNFMALFPGSP